MNPLIRFIVKKYNVKIKRMKKQARISLKKLSVQSFVTSLDDKQKETVGGGEISLPSYEFGCFSLATYACCYTYEHNNCPSRAVLHCGPPHGVVENVSIENN